MGCLKLEYKKAGAELNIVHSKFSLFEKKPSENTRRASIYRIHDPEIGRFLSREPLAADFAYNSPYAFAENKLGIGIELEGLELVFIHNTYNNLGFITSIRLV